MREEDRNPPGVPVTNGLRVLVEVPSLREALEKPFKIALEMVCDEYRHAGSFLDDLFKRTELLIVDFFPGAFLIGVDRAGCALETLHRESSG